MSYHEYFPPSGNFEPNFSHLARFLDQTAGLPCAHRQPLCGTGWKSRPGFKCAAWISPSKVNRFFLKSKLRYVEVWSSILHLFRIWNILFVFVPGILVLLASLCELSSYLDSHGAYGNVGMSRCSLQPKATSPIRLGFLANPARRRWPGIAAALVSGRWQWRAWWWEETLLRFFVTGSMLPLMEEMLHKCRWCVDGGLTKWWTY